MNTRFYKWSHPLVLFLLAVIFLLGFALPAFAAASPPVSASAGDQPVNTGFETVGEGGAVTVEWSNPAVNPIGRTQESPAASRSAGDAIGGVGA